MKRSRSVSLGLVPMVAAWFAACGQPAPPTHQQVCADQNDRVVEERNCEGEPGASWTQNAQPGGGHGFVPYHWYFLPYRTGGYPLGYGAVGGAYVAPAAGTGSRVAIGRVASPSVRTGGFGSTWHGTGVGA